MNNILCPNKKMAQLIFYNNYSITNVHGSSWFLVSNFAGDNYTGKFTMLCHVHPLPHDIKWNSHIMLTSVQSCHSPTKINISLIFCVKRETPEIIPQRCGHPICRIWIRWTTASGMSFKRGSTVRGSMLWRSQKNLMQWRLLDHSIIVAAITQWHSLSA